MAISLIAKPSDDINPCYNPLTFVADSTNKNQPAFRYVYSLYSGNTSTLLGEFKIAPREFDGYGIFNCERYLQNYLTYDVDLTNTLNAYDATKSYIEYKLGIGEEYGTDWLYDDYEFYNNTGSTFNAYTQLRQFTSGTTHTYNVGDQINVTQSDGGALKPILEGLHTIVAVPSPYIIVLDVPFSSVGSGASISGVTNYADNRKVAYKNLFTISSQTAFNGAIPFTEWVNYNEVDYNMSSGSSKEWLTKCPNNFKNTIYQDMWFNYMGDDSLYPKYLYIVTSDGDEFLQALNGNKIEQIKVGANNIEGTALVGSLPIIKDTTKWYTFTITDSSTTFISKTIQINLDRRCYIDYNGEDPYSIAFLDRLGSFGSFTFQLRRFESGTIERNSFLKQIEYTSGSEFTYNTWDKGNTIYNIKQENELVLNTNWMTESEAEYFNELISSPATFIKVDGIYIACEVKDTSVEKNKQKNKNLIRKTIRVKYSNNDPINI